MKPVDGIRMGNSYGCLPEKIVVSADLHPNVHSYHRSDLDPPDSSGRGLNNLAWLSSTTLTPVRETRSKTT